MEYFKKMDVIVEVGPGNKFTKMLRREWPEKTILSINEQRDIDELLTVLGRPLPVMEREYDESSVTAHAHV